MYRPYLIRFSLSCVIMCRRLFFFCCPSMVPRQNIMLLISILFFECSNGFSCSQFVVNVVFQVPNVLIASQNSVSCRTCQFKAEPRNSQVSWILLNETQRTMPCCAIPTPPTLVSQILSFSIALYLSTPPSCTASKSSKLRCVTIYQEQSKKQSCAVAAGGSRRPSMIRLVTWRSICHR